MTHYTLILGTKNASSWSLRPYLAFTAAGLPFEEVVIRLNEPETKAQILKHSPAGKVPILKMSDGGKETVVFDSLAICETLAERHPEAGLWPSHADARAFARSISAVMHSSFAELRATLPMDFARKKPAPALSAPVKEQIRDIIGYWQSALDRFGRGEFLFGKFSIADCMYAPVVSRFRTYGIEVPETLGAWCDRMFELPAMRAWEEASKAEIRDGLAGPT